MRKIIKCTCHSRFSVLWSNLPESIQIWTKTNARVTNLLGKVLLVDVLKAKSGSCSALGKMVPVDGFLSLFLEELISFGEMLTVKESSVRRERRRMNCLENMVLLLQRECVMQCLINCLASGNVFPSSLSHKTFRVPINYVNLDIVTFSKVSR